MSTRRMTMAQALVKYLTVQHVERDGNEARFFAGLWGIFGPWNIGGVARAIQQAEADFDPLPFDAAAARAFGQVASSLRRSGRKPAARALDALIAATAIANGLPLYTCNPDDFAGIESLALRPVPVPEPS